MAIQTLLIGLDGATFSILDGFMRDGTMPFLRDFTAAGVRADLRSTIPALTPPAWTSLVTGQGPGRHGIFDFFRKETPESHTIRFLTSQDIGCETIWSIVNRYGLRATVLNFPLMFPAPPIDGYVVPGGWMPWRQLRSGCHPATLYDQLKAALPGFNPRGLAMDMTHEAKAIEGCRQDEYGDWIDLHIQREQQWFDVAQYLMQEDPTELVAIMFDGVDKLQHLCWRFIDPAYQHTLTAHEQGVREHCLEYFRRLDHLVAKLVTLAGPEANVVIASDHGFGAQVRTLFVNTWLQQQGYLQWADGQGPQTSEDQVMGVSQVARHTYLLDWNDTQAYGPLPSGNGIHIVQADAVHPNGVPADIYEHVCNQLIDGLRELRDPEGDQPVVTHIWKREDIFDGPWLDLAPDLTLELQDGGLFSIMAGQTPVVPRQQPIGTHLPEGVFMACGPDLRSGAQLPELSILDIAPLLLYSLEVPIMTDMEGRLPEEALKPETLAARPVERDTPLQPTSTNPSAHIEPLWDEEGEAEVMRRLQALGYVE